MKNKLEKILRSAKAKKMNQDTQEDVRKQESLKDKAQGSGFSGSAYNAKGSVDHGKIKSNKKRR